MSTFIDVDLSGLKDAEVEAKLQELTRKYFTAQRLGKPELLTQLNSYITMYRQEISARAQKSRSNLDDDLNQLINVD
jgi:uncharacterized membrane protein